MAVGKETRGPLWVDGQFTVRLKGPGPEPGRIIRLRRPFALIGQIPGADIRIDDPAVDGRHALLLLDRRGVFGVDLLSGTGTRFAGAASASSWLGAGDILEVAGRRIELLQLRVDGASIDPPLSDDDLLSDSPELVGLTLEPLDRDGPPWMLGSALAFVGRGDACAIRIEDASASRTHCALLRGPSDAYAIDLLGRRTLINEQPVEGSSALLDGDILTIGRARFTVRIDPAQLPPSPAPSTMLARLADAYQGSAELSIDSTPGPQGAAVALLLNAVESGRDSSRFEVLDALRQFQADTATLLEAQIDRIEVLNREIASLRDEIRGHRGPPRPPAEPFRIDLSRPPTTPPGESASWLLDRLNTLETESRSTWKDLFGRITSSIGPRTNQSSGRRTLTSTTPKPHFDD
jgi:pSer/pThr/pTyr-binding forkhead associated (FHA) protein